MSLGTLAAAAVLIAGSTGPIGTPGGMGATPPVVELGLTSPLVALEEIESFRRDVAERLVWTVRTGEEGRRVRIRFTAVRIDRGRVAASYQSEIREAFDGLASVAESLGVRAFMAFPDVCLSPEDPPAEVRAVSGSRPLEADRLEGAIARAARSADFAGSFGLEEPLDIEWGRHVVLVLAASDEASAILVRPLILVLERK